MGSKWTNSVEKWIKNIMCKSMEWLRRKLAILKVGVEIFDGRYITKKMRSPFDSWNSDFGPRAKKNTRWTPWSNIWASIIVNEGKFRQIRKMTAAVGFPTWLVRIRIGNVHLQDLKGEVMEVASFD
jgi:23S rRNA pseudouridine2457 synthase